MTSTLKSAFFAVAIVATATSCMKKPNLSEDDGEVVPAKTVQQALFKAWGNDSYSDIKVGEFTATDVTLKLADLPAYTTMQDSKEITGVRDSQDHLSNIFTLHHHVVEDASGSQKPSDEQFEIGPIAKPALAAAAAIAPLRQTASDISLKAAQTPITPFSLEFMLMLFQICGQQGITCHNLKIWQEVQKPPTAVAARSGCEGLQDCKMNVNGIAFDYVTQVHDNESNSNVRVKQRLSAKMSPDVPVLSRVTEFCIAGVEVRNGAMYPATTCYNITNFRRGTSP